MNGATGSISGRVVEANDIPVAGATVAISESPQPHSDIAALTGADGRFRLGSLAPGPYILVAHSTVHAPGGASVVVVAGQQSDVEIRLDALPDDVSVTEAVLEVRLVTEFIDWHRVRLVRVSLNYNDPDHGVAVANDFFFSRVGSDFKSWKVELKDRDRDQYVYKIVYFMVDGLQRIIGPEDANDRDLILRVPS